MKLARLILIVLFALSTVNGTCSTITPVYLGNGTPNSGDPNPVSFGKINTNFANLNTDLQTVFDNAFGVVRMDALPTVIRNYTTEATSAIDNRIKGKTGNATTMAVFSAVNDTTHAYTRNASLFCADLDLTCISSSTSAGWRITMVTAKHGITAHHIGMAVGTVGYWTDASNNTYSRTVTAVTNIVSGSDMDMVTLNSDLPASITPAQILPYTFPPGYQTGAGSLLGCPVITHDQNRHFCLATAQVFYSPYATPVTPYDTLIFPTTGPYAPFNRGVDTAGANTPAISGDSSSPYFIVIGGKPVLLGCFFGVSGAGPDPGANQIPLQAAIGSGYGLKVVNMPLNQGGGATGATGPGATVAIGSVSTGSSAQVTNSGTSTAAVLNFTLPKGDAGAQGPAGPATLTMGTVTQLASGATPTATLTNNGAGAYTLNFGIPQSGGVNGTAINPASVGATTPGTAKFTSITMSDSFGASLVQLDDTYQFMLNPQFGYVGIVNGGGLSQFDASGNEHIILGTDGGLCAYNWSTPVIDADGNIISPDLGISTLDNEGNFRAISAGAPYNGVLSGPITLDGQGNFWAAVGTNGQSFGNGSPIIDNQGNIVSQSVNTSIVYTPDVSASSIQGQPGDPGVFLSSELLYSTGPETRTSFDHVKGPVLYSPNGTAYYIQVSNTGTLTTHTYP